MNLATRIRCRVSAAVALVTTAGMSTLAFAAPATPEDIRDIQGPIAIPAWWHWPLVIGIAAIAAFVVIAVVRFVRSRMHVLTPLERARKALDAAEVHARAGQSHAWADIVAETIRGALATRIGAEILPQTTSELAQSSWATSPLADDLDVLHVLELLATCDLARFAKATLDPNALVESTAIARQLVDRLFAPPPRAELKAAREITLVQPVTR